MNLRKVDNKLMDIKKQAREARNAYARAWRARNRDKVKTYNESYWIRKAAQDEQKAAAERG